MELKTYLRILKQRWKAAVVGLLFVFGLTYGFVTLTAKPIFQSSGEFSIKILRGKFKAQRPILEKPLNARIKPLTNLDTLEQTSKKLREEENIKRDARELKKSITYKHEDRIVSLEATDTKQTVPQKVLTYLFEVFKSRDKQDLKQTLELELDDITGELEHIQERKQTLESQTESMRRNLVGDISFLIKHSPRVALSRLSSRLQNLDARSASLERQRREYRENFNLIERAEEKLTTSRSEISMETVNEDLVHQLNLEKDPGISPLLKKKRELETTRQQLIVKYTPRHPRIEKINSQLENLNRQIAEEYRNGALRRKLKSIQRKLKDINNELIDIRREAENLQKEINAINTYLEKKEELDELDKRIDTLSENKESIEYQLEKQKEWMAWDQQPTEARPITSQNRMSSILLALTLGLIGAVMSSYLVEYFSNIIRRPKDVRLYFGINPIASVPKLQEDTKLDLHLEKDFPARELFNKLAVFFDSLSLELDSNTFLITSSRTGEGKSLLCSNIGISLARSGEDVLLLDADLRKPVFHDLFNVPREPGFSDLLQKYGDRDPGSVDIDRVLEDYTRDVSVPRLSILPAGRSTDNPISLLKSPLCREIIRKLEERDVIILLDSPPIGTLVDAAVLAGYAAATVLVVGEGEVKRTEAARVKHTLNQVGANVAGAIINKVKLEPEEYYYYYRYTQGKHGY